MPDEKKLHPNPQNFSELDPEKDVDPLTDTRTVAQTPTDDKDIHPLPEQDGVRAGDYDTTTNAAHPAADSGADRGVSDGKN